MNRRSILKAAAAGIAAACEWKAAKAEPVIGLRIGESAVCEPYEYVISCDVQVNDNGEWTRSTWVDSDGKPITNSMGEPISIEIPIAMWEHGKIDIDDVRRMELL